MQLVKLTESEYQEFLATQSDYSFLQTPAWGKIKSGWSYELLGFKNPDLIGVALVLYKSAPIIKKYKLAYVPEGPVLNWQKFDPAALTALTSYLKQKNCFLLKIGPKAMLHRYSNDSLKAGLADENIKLISCQMSAGEIGICSKQHSDWIKKWDDIEVKERCTRFFGEGWYSGNSVSAYYINILKKNLSVLLRHPEGSISCAYATELPELSLHSAL